MWTCLNCSEVLVDNFDSCWKCAHDRWGVKRHNLQTEIAAEHPTGLRLPNAGALSIPSHAKPVVIVDIQMPFWSMVAFMVKWSLAAIPALLILMLILGTVAGLMFG